MEEYKKIIELFPTILLNSFKEVDKKHLEKAEEIRLRTNKPIIIFYNGNEFFLTKNKGLSSMLNSESFIVTQEIINTTIKIMCNFSLYAIEEDLKQGYFTLQGGHRVGICGSVVNEGMEIRTMKNISSLNIRIAKEIKGSGLEIVRTAFKDGIKHTLIISPPGCGKTTLLRDVIRILSCGESSLKLKGYKIGLVDERSEIASSFMGVPQNDIGIRTDVLDGCLKVQGINMLLRSMAPEIIAVDEIGSLNEVDAIENAINSGVKILATAHGKDLDEIKKRAGIKELISCKAFERLVILSRRNGPGTIDAVIDL